MCVSIYMIEKFFQMCCALHARLLSCNIISDSITVKSNACGHPCKCVLDRRTKIADIGATGS